MKVSDIKINEKFLHTPPAQYKMNICRNYFAKNGCIDRNIILDKNNVLIDGYVGYLVLKENHIETTEVIYYQKPKMKIVPCSAIYVFACHAGNPKEYVWRMKKNSKEIINIGDNILVNTKCGNKVVTITRIENLATPPVATPIRKVLKCLNSAKS